MAKFHNKQIGRLQRRQAKHDAADKATTLPGSMNRHKSVAVGRGKRSKMSIQDDSRQATIN